MEKISFERIIKLINCDYKIQGYGIKNYVTNVKTVMDADEYTLMWINHLKSDKEEILKGTKAKVIICDDTLSLNEQDINNKVLIQVDNPKLVFIQLVEELFTEKPVYEIHPSSVIHKEAKIADNVYIGPLTYIGRSEIKEGTIIYGNVHIYDGVKIGRNVTIEAGCSIGAAGYNFVRDENRKLHKFPHLGGVIIEDDVEIQALSVIDRGVLEDTVIGKGTKIDSCCYIAHNCKIGENNAIVGHTMLSGSVRIGNDCWIGPATVVRDNISIDSESFMGMGSVVVSALKANSKVMGNPARPIDDMKKILNKFKKHIADEK